MKQATTKAQLPSRDKCAYTTRGVDQIYKELVTAVLTHGEDVRDRTGVGTRSLFGLSYAIHVGEVLPLITTKKVFTRSVIAELLWFLEGDQSIHALKEHTSIWDDWARAVGVTDDGQARYVVPSAYGRYWRYFPSIPADQTRIGEAVDPSTHGTDQLRYVADLLTNNPHSRRGVISAWHPANATVSTLPPCHFAMVFNVHRGRLCLDVMQRSGDLALGIPFNMLSYGLLLMLMAREIDKPVGILRHNITDAHIYQPHIPKLRKQVARPSKSVAPPSVELPDVSLFDLGLKHVDDFKITDYTPHPAITYEVAV